MPDTDFRALCAELLTELQTLRRAVADETGYPSPEPSAITRARAALAQPEEPTDEELLRVAASVIDPYESSGIAIGEYEPETECVIEVYGSELIAYARAVLARYGTLTNNIREEN
jgi:hypothetical protein